MRVILKLSGEGLSGDSGESFDNITINRIVGEVNQLLELGVEVAIVVGGGNFWRGGRSAPKEMDKVKAHQIGMVATIMNAIYLSEAFRIASGGEEQKCSVMTPFEAGGFTKRFNKYKAIEYMQNGIVPIFAGGTGHPFFSTDSIVAIRACELNADMVLFAKHVEAVYESDPKKDSTAKKYKSVCYKTIMSKQLSVADISAIALISDENIDSCVFSLATKGGIVEACKTEESLYLIGGTKISNNIEDIFY